MRLSSPLRCAAQSAGKQNKARELAEGGVPRVGGVADPARDPAASEPCGGGGPAATKLCGKALVFFAGPGDDEPSAVAPALPDDSPTKEARAT